MPRGKQKTAAEKLEQLNRDISTYEQALQKLYEKREELLQQKQREEVSMLINLLGKKGLTIEEAASILDSYQEQDKTA